MNTGIHHVRPGESITDSMRRVLGCVACNTTGSITTLTLSNGVVSDAKQTPCSHCKGRGINPNFSTRKERRHA